MENLHKKVIWNAISAYFLLIVSIFFLFSKQEYINHPFVKNHVKAAFSLHILLLGMYFVMSYDFLDGVDVLWYSINTIITAIFSLWIFGAMLYGAYEAHRGKTTSLGEIFHTAGLSKEIVRNNTTEKLQEEQTLLLILAHIPFIGYIIYPRHKDIPHIRDVSQLNLFVTVVSCLLASVGYLSLASLCMLAYIIWGVFQSLRLVFQNEIITLDLSKAPTAEEKYILQKSLLTYLWNTLGKKTFSPLKSLVEEKTKLRRETELADIKKLKTLKKSVFPSWIFYVPVVNILGLFALKSYDSFHIKNGITISLIFVLMFATLGWDSPLLVFVLFPICYGIGYIDRKAYKMPYIYDIYSFFGHIFSGIWHIFHRTRTLQKTEKKVSVKMTEETKKES